MKSRQLANVLIKITGLYFCVSNIPVLVSGILAAYVQDAMKSSGYEMGFGIWNYLGSAIIESLLGILLIAKSQRLASFWFKSEE